MVLNENDIFFYQAKFVGCSFVKIVKKINAYRGNRVYIVSFLILIDADNIPLHDDIKKYEELKEKGVIMNVWNMEESILKEQILIPYKDMQSNRYKTIKSKRKFANLTIPIGMDDNEILLYKRNKKILDILK